MEKCTSLDDGVVLTVCVDAWFVHSSLQIKKQKTLIICCLAFKKTIWIILEMEVPVWSSKLGNIPETNRNITASVGSAFQLEFLTTSSKNRKSRLNLLFSNFLQKFSFLPVCPVQLTLSTWSLHLTLLRLNQLHYSPHIVRCCNTTPIVHQLFYTLPDRGMPRTCQCLLQPSSRSCFSSNLGSASSN